MTPDPENDRQLLADAFDRFVDDLIDGKETDTSHVLADRPDLEDQVQEKLRLALALTGRRRVRRPELAGYRIVRELGRGGMGTVYLAREERLGRDVALKVLPPSLGLSERSRRRFVSEARALARIQDDHVVRIFEIVERDDLLAYAMEWVEGRSLRQILDELNAQGGKPTVADFARCLGAEENALAARSHLQLMVQLGVVVARALANVHAAGLVHRDVKPSNILLRRDGTPLLADFGLARGADRVLTQTSAFVGTPVYAAPEQLAGDAERIDARTDVYALGVTLYEAITFALPFTGRSTTEVLRKIEAGAAPPLRRLAPHAPKDLETILAKAMEPDPDRRYQTAAELADDLDKLLHLQPIQARPAGTLRRLGKAARRHARPLLAAGLAALVVLAAMLVLLFEERQRRLVPERVAELVRAARLSLLSPEVGVLGVADVQGAQEAYERALALDPGNDELRLEVDIVKLGTWYRTTGLSRSSIPETIRHLGGVTLEAVEQLAIKLPKIEPETLQGATVRDRKALGLLAYVTNFVGLCEQAWAGLDAHQLAFPLADAALGRLFLADGRPAPAYARLQRALEAFPNVGFLAVDLADAALRIREVDEAQRWLTRARTLPTGTATSPAFHRVEADLLRAQGKAREARAVYELLRDRDRFDSKPELRLAKLDQDERNYAGAQHRLEQVVEKWPNLAQARLALARVALGRKDMRGYFPQVREVLRMDYGRGRSKGTVRDLLEILRIGGLEGLLERGAAATGSPAVPERGSTPRFPAAAMGFASREEVEALLTRLDGFEKDGANGFPIRLPPGAAHRLARGVSFLSRLTTHFPEAGIMSGPKTQLPALAAACWCRANWSKLTQSILPAIVATLGLGPVADAQHHLFTFPGSSNGDWFGCNTGGAGDVDRDGHADILVGAARADVNGRTNSGWAGLYSARNGRLIHSIAGGAAHDHFGSSVCGGEDFNGDGVLDFVVGAKQTSSSSAALGYVVAYSGKTPCPVLWTVRGKTRGECLGEEVELVGDQDGDKVRDVLIGGAMLLSSGDYALLCSGRTGVVLKVLPGWRSAGYQGMRVANVGDIDGNGYDDLAVSATGSGVTGYVQIFQGKTFQSLWIGQGASVGDYFGVSIAGLGDVDRDGYDDFAVGAHGVSGAGYVNVYSGKTRQLLHTFRGAANGDELGNAVAGPGDVNRDGFPDLLAGAPRQPGSSGYAVLYSGQWIAKQTGPQILLRCHSDVPNDRFGWEVASTGDVNGDGSLDFAVGAEGNLGPGYARIFSGKALSLETDTHQIPLATGGTQTFRFYAGTAHANRFCVLLGSASGIEDGIKLGPGVTLPLKALDWLTGLSLTLLRPAVGQLDAKGNSTAKLTLPPLPGVTGHVTVDHAYVVLNPKGPQPFPFASNSAPLLLR